MFRKVTVVLTMLSDSHSLVSDSLQPKGCSLPSSSVRAILRLEWAAISSSRGSSQPRGQTWVSWWILYRLSHPVLRRDRDNRPHMESLVLSPCHHQTKTRYLNLITGLIIALPQRAGASQVAQREQIQLLTQEMRVQPLGQKLSLEKEMATHSPVLAWEMSWTEEPGRLHSMASQKNLTRLSN